MSNYQIVIIHPQSPPDVGPVAETFAEAVEAWYLRRCEIHAWSNKGEGFACDEHEQTMEAKNQLAELYKCVMIDCTEEEICVVVTPDKVDVNPQPSELRP